MHIFCTISDSIFCHLAGGRKNPGVATDNFTLIYRLREGVRYIFNGPIIFVVFYTDGSKNRGGFLFNFEGVGMQIPNPYDYHHLEMGSEKREWELSNMNSKVTKDKPSYTTVVVKSSSNDAKLHMESSSTICPANELRMYSNFFPQDWIPNSQ